MKVVEMQEHVPETEPSNYLLALLPGDDRGRVNPHLRSVYLERGAALYESGDRLANVYFPTTSIVSLLCVMENGESAEIAAVGNDGIVGLSLFMGEETMPNRAIVRCEGGAWRMNGAALKAEFDRGGALHDLLLKYTLSLLNQMAQTVVCNRHHTVDQQLCRLLLLSVDRVPAGELCMTQETIATSLGVRREGVTEAAGKLQGAGLISYRRGRITIVDRAGLESRACECYGVLRRESARLHHPA